MHHTDPFAEMTRRRRLAARRDRMLRMLRRPFAGTRIDARRGGPPNLLLLAVDTLRDDHVRPDDDGRGTPAMTALAREGLRFADTMSPAPWTLPSFASALTGMMPSLHGGGMTGRLRNMAEAMPQRVHDSAPTLASHLTTHGYRTAAFTSNPFVQFGLAESFGEHRYRNHAAADVAAGALDWIRRHGDRPFCCFALFNDPHEPTMPPLRLCEHFLPDAQDATVLRALARWGGESGVPHVGRMRGPAAEAALAIKRGLYAASVRSVDETIDAVLQQLGAWGLDRNTIVCLWSDHGEEFREHADAAELWDHDPRNLRAIGHGHSHFEELLRVPWIVCGPGLPQGATRRESVSLCDLTPTLTDWLGLPAFPLPKVEGEGLLGRILGREAPGTPEDRLLLAENIAYGPDLVAVRRGRWKLIAYRDPPTALALYDLEADPGETEDRREAEPAVTGGLLARIEAWNRQVRPELGGDGGDLDERILQGLKDLGYV
jgi:arylsulfatase A-like enzyme